MVLGQSSFRIQRTEVAEVIGTTKDGWARNGGRRDDQKWRVKNLKIIQAADLPKMAGATDSAGKETAALRNFTYTILSRMAFATASVIEPTWSFS
jgi:hypothetical protein